MYLEHDWKMPRGFLDKNERDPRNFTLEQWQQAKRCGYHARDLKGLIQDCYAVSDSRAAFAAALEEKGFKLARGDRRTHVVVTHEGEVLSVARYTGKKAKEVREKLGDEKELKSVEETKQQFVSELKPVFKDYLEQSQRKCQKQMAPLERAREKLTTHHRSERVKLETQQKQRWEQESKERADRLNKGLRGLWDRFTGTRKTVKENENQAYAALQRDKDQTQELIQAQLRERQRLQTMITQQRAKEVKERLEIHKRLYELKQSKLEPETPARQQQQRTQRRYSDNQKPKTKIQSPVRTTKTEFAKAAGPNADAWKNRTPSPATENAKVVVKSKMPQRKQILPQERLDQLRRDYEKTKDQNASQTRATMPKFSQDKLNALRKRQRPSHTRDKNGPSIER